MRRLVGAAVAAVAIAWAGSASAATYILDFENYDIGGTFGTGGNYTPVAGSPYETVWLHALVTAAPGGLNGNAARLSSEEVSFSPDIDPGGVRYTPFLNSIDVYMPNGGRIGLSGGVSINVPAGEWFTWAPEHRIGSSHETKFFSPGGYVYIDNIKITDFYSAAPEPMTWALMLTGFGVAGASLRRARCRSLLA